MKSNLIISKKSFGYNHSKDLQGRKLYKEDVNKLHNLFHFQVNYEH